MFPDIHHLAQLLPIALIVGVFLIVVVVFVIILVILLRKVQKLQALQQVQVARQQQPSFVAPPSIPVPVALSLASMRPTPVQKPSLPLQQTATQVQQQGTLENRSWLSLVEDNIAIYDELDRNMESFDEQSKQLGEHILLRLEEILERSGVSLIQGETTFDRHRHQPIPVTTSVAHGAPIIATLSSGFVVDGRILRRAHVRA